MPTIMKNSLQGRILTLILERYPITVEEVARELGERLPAVRMEFHKMQKSGWVALEPLKESTFVRVLRRDFGFVGTNPSQRRRVKHRTGRARRGSGGDDEEEGGEEEKEKKPSRYDDDSSMYA